MSRICLAALAVVLSMTSFGFAQTYEYGNYGATYNMYTTPAPAGMRFGGADTAIYPKGDVAGVGNGCSTCGANAMCIDWKLNTWYGSWEDRQPHGGHHGRGCGSDCEN